MHSPVHPIVLGVHPVVWTSVRPVREYLCLRQFPASCPAEPFLFGWDNFAEVFVSPMHQPLVSKVNVNAFHLRNASGGFQEKGPPPANIQRAPLVVMIPLPSLLMTVIMSSASGPMLISSYVRPDFHVPSGNDFGEVHDRAHTVQERVPMEVRSATYPSQQASGGGR